MLLEGDDEMMMVVVVVMIMIMRMLSVNMYACECGMMRMHKRWPWA